MLTHCEQVLARAAGEHCDRVQARANAAEETVRARSARGSSNEGINADSKVGVLDDRDVVPVHGHHVQIPAVCSIVNQYGEQ